MKRLSHLYFRYFFLLLFIILQIYRQQNKSMLGLFNRVAINGYPATFADAAVGAFHNARRCVIGGASI